MCGLDEKTVGYVVRLQTVNGEYEGTVKSFSKETEKVVLEKVIVLPSEEKLKGLQNFYPQEIRSYQVVRKNCDFVKKQSAKRLPEERGSKLVSHRLQPLPLHHRSARVGETKDIDDEDGEEEASEIEDFEEPFLKEGPIRLECNEYGTKRPLDVRFQLPSTFLFIDCLDESFRGTITEIERHGIVGVTMEGAPLSRDGEVCWLVISTKHCVYFFDILKLQIDAFTAGLKNILESPHIMKVFHDCRLSSDALFHKYGISLENVFDTQVADIVSHCRRYNNTLPRFAHSITTCVPFYLHLSHELVDCPKVRLACQEKDLSEWKRRPLSSAYRDAAIRKVVFLRELRVAILEALLLDVNAGITHFLGAVRDASSEEVESLNLGDAHLIPPGMNQLDYRTCKDYNPSNRIHHSHDIPNGTRSRKLANGHEDDICVGDLLNPGSKRFSVNKWNNRRSLPSEFLTTSNKNNRDAINHRTRSCTTPLNTMVNGHGATMAHKNYKAVHQNGDVVTKRNVDLTELQHIAKRGQNKLSFPESTDDSGTDLSADSRKFSWPSISPIQQNQKNCIPAGMQIR